MDAKTVRGQRFIEYCTPARVMLLGLLMYLLLVASAPLQFDMNFFSTEGLVFITVSLMGFWLGCAIASKGNSSAVSHVTGALSRRQVDHLIWATLVLGAAGTLLRIYDRFFLRGLEFSEDMILARESLTSNVSVFGYIGGALFPLSIACLMLHWWGGGRRPLTFLAAAVLSAYSLVETLALGSRSTSLQIVFLVAFCAAASGRLRLSHVLWGLAALSVPLLISWRAIYETRTIQLGYESIVDIYLLNSITLYASPQDWIVSWLGIEGSFFVDAFVRPWLHLSQYAASTWLIFMDNFASFSGALGWGQLQFNVPLRALSVVFDIDNSYDAEMEGMKVGLYSTTFSTIYYDCGWFGPAVTFAFGYASTRLHAMAMREPHCWLLLYAVVVFACALALVENQFLYGYFALAVWSFLLYGVIASLWTRLSWEGGQSR